MTWCLMCLWLMAIPLLYGFLPHTPSIPHCAYSTLLTQAFIPCCTSILQENDVGYTLLLTFRVIPCIFFSFKFCCHASWDSWHGSVVILVVAMDHCQGHYVFKRKLISMMNHPSWSHQLWRVGSWTQGSCKHIVPPWRRGKPTKGR